MKYVPAITIALGITLPVCLGLYLTKDPNCLWGLTLMYVAYHAIPFKKEHEF